MYQAINKKYTQGVGLIEVMVTVVVVALGLLALANLQTGLMRESGTNKARAEAKMLCEQKVEELRGLYSSTDFAAITNSASAESITGKNATIEREWAVVNLTNPARKQIVATCSWSEADGQETDVKVESILAFKDPKDALLASAFGKGGGGGSGGAGPSLTGGSMDDITETIAIPEDMKGQVTAGQVIEIDGKLYIVNTSEQSASKTDLCSNLTPAVSEFEGFRARRVDYDSESGAEAIELFSFSEVNSSEYCTPQVRFNGGVIIPIRGIVHSRASVGTGNNTSILDVKLFSFNATETGAFCVFNPPADASSHPYVCYIGGNCKNNTSTDSIEGLETDFTKCPAVQYSYANVGEGGWRGKLGLLGIAPQNRNVCFAEELLGEPNTRDTARNYFARRNNLNEGINIPYNCHDFLIIDGQANNKQLHQECVSQATSIAGLQLASKEIMRTISTGVNYYDPIADITYCGGAVGTDYIVTGSYTNAIGEPSIKANVGLNSFDCNIDVSLASYSCSFKTTADSVIIYSDYDGQRYECDSLPLSSSTLTGCTLNFPTSENPAYNIQGYLVGTETETATFTVTIDDGIGTYNCPLSTYADGKQGFVCTFNSSATSATLTPFSYSYTTDPISSPLTLPTSTPYEMDAGNFVVQPKVIETISGTIQIANDNNLSNLDTVALNISEGSCSYSGTPTWDKNSTANYACEVPANQSLSMSVSVDPACAKAQNSNTAAKNLTITASGYKSGTSTSGGSLVLADINISANQTINFLIEEGTTDCGTN
ncbi:hypothetical protein D5125_17100 [Magnetovirga frankeli]|uniref:hypothetical protein n=1 Tax=Magnetovirga frankeli TaxID=947516 RepID=UPI001293E0C8|nr:hypothetical protein D5125_17100 [gamma proteobacterium SS-5]